MTMQCPLCYRQMVEYPARPKRGEEARLECPGHWVEEMLPEWCPQEAMPVPVHVVLERAGCERLPGMP